jgi:hypothetical protein
MDLFDDSIDTSWLDEMVEDEVQRKMTMSAVDEDS